MKLEFEITKFRGKVGTADAAAYVDGKKVTTCCALMGATIFLLSVTATAADVLP